MTSPSTDSINMAEEAIELARLKAKTDAFVALNALPNCVRYQLILAEDFGLPTSGEWLMQAITHRLPLLGRLEVRESVLNELLRIYTDEGSRLAEQLIAEIEQLGEAK